MGQREIREKAVAQLRAHKGQGVHLALVDVLNFGVYEATEELQHVDDVITLYRAQGRVAALTDILKAINADG